MFGKDFPGDKWWPRQVERKLRGMQKLQLELVNNSSKNGPISFSIVGGNLDAAFQLDASGQIRTALELDAEIRASYFLHILAISGDGQRAECHLRVRVLDREDNAPAIRRIATIRLPEGCWLTL